MKGEIEPDEIGKIVKWGSKDKKLDREFTVDQTVHHEFKWADNQYAKRCYGYIAAKVTVESGTYILSRIITRFSITGAADREKGQSWQQ